MSAAAQVKPTHKAIQQYYATLQGYQSRHVEHEGALETGFQRLLADTCRVRSWNLVPKLKAQAGKKLLFPDGTLIDDFNLKRGFWEAKDTHDDLEEEISKKIAKGYPLNNIIFEDTRRPVLFQNGARGFREGDWGISRSGCRSWRSGWTPRSRRPTRTMPGPQQPGFRFPRMHENQVGCSTRVPYSWGSHRSSLRNSSAG